MEYYRKQEDDRVTKIKEEEEARKREGASNVWHAANQWDRFSRMPCALSE